MPWTQHAGGSERITLELWARISGFELFSRLLRDVAALDDCVVRQFRAWRMAIYEVNFACRSIENPNAIYRNYTSIGG